MAMLDYLSPKMLVQLYCLTGYFFNHTSNWCGFDLREYTIFELRQFQNNMEVKFDGLALIINRTVDDDHSIMFTLDAELFYHIIEDWVPVDYYFKINVGRNPQNEQLYFTIIETNKGPSIIQYHIKLKLFEENPSNISSNINRDNDEDAF